MSNTPSEPQSNKRTREGDLAADSANKRGRTETKPRAAELFRYGSRSAPADVELLILGDVHRVHSTVLCNSSEYFEKSLSKEWWKPENTHNRPDGIKYRYKFELEEKNGYIGFFEPIPPNSGPVRSQTEPDDGQVRLLYELLLGMFYNHMFGPDRLCALRNSEEAILNVVRKIVDISEVLCCLDTVTSHIEPFLFRWCWQATDKNELTNGYERRYLRISRWIEILYPLSLKLQSVEFYQECFTHFVGIWATVSHGEHACYIVRMPEAAKEIFYRMKSIIRKLPRSEAHQICERENKIQFYIRRALAALARTLYRASQLDPEFVDDLNKDDFADEERMMQMLREMWEDEKGEGPLVKYVDDDSWAGWREEHLWLLCDPSVSYTPEVRKYDYFISALAPDVMPWELTEGLAPFESLPER